MALPVQLTLHDDEAAIDFVARLAVANGYTSLRTFLSQTDITASQLIRGDEEALAIVTRWTGIKPSELGRFSTSTLGPGSGWSLGRAVLSKEMRSGHNFRFCASCVVADRHLGTGRLVSRPYRRAWWSVRGIEGCPAHGCGMTTIAVSADVDNNDFPSFVKSNLELIEVAATRPERSSTPSLDRYLKDRILAGPTDDFLGGLEAHVVFEFSRYFGDFLRLHDALDRRSDEEIDLRERGFIVARGGVEAVRQAFVEVIDRKRPSSKYVEKVLGPMVRWFRRNAGKPEYSSLVDLVHDVLERNMPFGVGQVILKPVQSRHVYCINSAHAEYGLTKDRIRALMAANDPEFRPGLPDGSTYFDAALFRPILAAAADTMTATEASAALGLTEARVHDLLEAGILEQAERRTDDDRAYTRIPSKAVDELTSKLTNLMAPSAGDEVLMSLSAAARSWRRPFHTIVAKILEGRLSASVLPGNAPLLQRMQVSKKAMELNSHPLDGSDEALVRLKEVELVLGTASITVSDLIERGYLKQRIARRDTGRNVKFVERASLDEFMETYASLSMIAKTRQAYRADIKKQLDQIGIAPIFEPKGFVARFYRRSDLVQVGYAA